jgi:hypothetical protein
LPPTPQTGEVGIVLLLTAPPPSVAAAAGMLKEFAAEATDIEPESTTVEMINNLDNFMNFDLTIRDLVKIY